MKKQKLKQLSKNDIQKLPHNKQIQFALFCAEQVFHLIEEEHKEVCRKAIDVTYLYLEGKATQEECRVAANAAYAAANAAAYASAYAATYAAADAAAYAAYAAYASYAAYAAAYASAYAANAAAYYATPNKEQVLKEQWEAYDNLLNADKYFEEIVLERKV